METIRTFAGGLAVGAAMTVPGVSGGSAAMLLGEKKNRSRAGKYQHEVPDGQPAHACPAEYQWDSTCNRAKEQESQRNLQRGSEQE